jgi:hypothetical protein
MNHKQAPEKQAEDYRRLAERIRETVQRVSTERERSELLAMAKIWNFLADHGPTTKPACVKPSRNEPALKR